MGVDVFGSDAVFALLVSETSAQMSGVTDRMGNVEENLVKLEDRLFGRLDGNEHQSRSRLHDAGVDAAKLQEARLKGQSNFIIISLSEWTTSDDLRKQPTNLENLFQFERGCSRNELHEPGVKRKASHQRLILQTELLNTAKRLALTVSNYPLRWSIILKSLRRLRTVDAKAEGPPPYTDSKRVHVAAARNLRVYFSIYMVKVQS
ncbi:unnamed protein product [Fusarium fujikuroi]|uniref:Uncharacterized protein n=1 Tax=Fusarium fujikuroi TaxID=5127 RepID=A0A9Q9RZK4_FUSFU|nr:unnamed protein product [Fusarium fujikuroi]VTT83282.1 unnamed protein product [Fusarium fujikuroi]VZH92308.1 unnamed protein product [Fusarium fujikuroi]